MSQLTRRLASGAVLGLVALLASLVAAPAGAVNRRLDLAKMTDLAGTIVSGRISQLRAGRHPRYQNIGVLYVTVKVNETLKGQPGNTVTFMQFTGMPLDNNGGKGLSMAHPMPDMPSYRVGEEVVLFLYPPSSVGFTSPVGGEQGKFIIHRQPGQPATVISEGGNRSLEVNGPLPGRLTKPQQSFLRHPSDSMDYGTFRATVKSLAQATK